MNHSKVTLKQLINNIDNNHFVVPTNIGRRRFIWDIIDVESLGDSIINAIPIASLVTMPSDISTSNEIQTKALISSYPVLNSVTEEYLIDGFHRVRAISDIFKGTDDAFLYYFDLMALLKAKFQNFFETDEDYYNQNTDGICKAFLFRETDRNKPRYLSAIDIQKNQFSKGIRKFFEELNSNNQFTETQMVDYLDYIATVISSINQYTIPITKISSDVSKNDIKRIYEKLNTPLLYQSN